MSTPRHSVKGPTGGCWAEALDQHRAAQRDHIVTVAFELLRERGMAALTMSAVAARAGLSRATVYRYFPDVDALLSAWVGREMHGSISQIVADARAITDPLRRIEHLVATQAALFERQDHRLSAEHFESEAGSPAVRKEVAAQMAPLRQLLADTITEADVAGLLATHVDPSLAADLVLGILGAVRRHIVGGTLSSTDAVSFVMTLLRSGWFDATTL
ncbi:MAG: TetR/AcrR family transcriptional regulator [Actinomycetota bacterium]|nr:TetR/AcrR family transcriptional regulator [Actinomycetota bacterium]